MRSGVLSRAHQFWVTEGHYGITSAGQALLDLRRGIGDRKPMAFDPRELL